MKIATVYAPFPYGSELMLCTVEASVQPGLPDVRIIGLPDRSVREALVRVRTAMQVAGLSFPKGRVVISIGPAHVPKRGTGFDLAIALVLCQVASKVFSPCIAYGELDLHSRLGESNLAYAASRLGKKHALPWLMPSQGEGKGKVVNSLNEAWLALSNNDWHDYPPSHSMTAMPTCLGVDEILGNDKAKRALLIALAGKHHLLLSGPAGVGKTLLAQSASQLLPRLTQDDEARLRILESQTRQGKRREAYAPPYYEVTSQTSLISCVGNMHTLTPGLISLSSQGVLLLDELPHLKREVLHSLHSLLEQKVVILSSPAYAQLPADTVVIATRNLCPCGRLGDYASKCLCTPSQLAQYSARISAPLLDRFPLHAEVDTRPTTQQKVGDAYAKIIGEVRKQNMTIPPSQKAKALFEQATSTFKLSYRGRAHLIAVSQTIAKIEQVGEISESHVHEAMQYRVRKV